VNLLLRNRLLFASAGGLTVAIAVYLYWDEHHAAPPSEPPPFGPPPHAITVLHSPVLSRRPGSRQPETVPVIRIWLADHTEVIGINAGGKHRAYALAAFTQATTQLVNDLVGDVPVTVTYCIKANRHRAFSSDQQGAPLDIWLLNSGVQDDLALRIGEGLFSQKSVKLPPPLKELPATRTTWKEWKQAHPNTDIYLRPPG
jgi:hypothetical protein